MGIKWWEKTVEYKFVLMAAKNGQQFIAPLDGDEERAGDAIFSTSSKWLLIEFKQSLESVGSEKKKFKNYSAARAVLSPFDAHHYLVFGFPNGGRLELNAQTYFSGRQCKNLDEMLNGGTDYQTFSAYIRQFTEFKKTKKSDGGGVGVDSYSLVAGVSAENELVECLSLSEFQRCLGLELQHEHEPERAPSGPER